MFTRTTHAQPAQLLFTLRFHTCKSRQVTQHALGAAALRRRGGRVQPPECRDLPAPHWPSLPKLEPTAGGGAYYALGEALRTQPAGIRGAADAAAYSYCLAHQLEPTAAADAEDWRNHEESLQLWVLVHLVEPLEPAKLGREGR